MIPVLMHRQLPFHQSVQECTCGSLQDDRKDGWGEIWRTRKQATDAVMRYQQREQILPQTLILWNQAMEFIINFVNTNSIFSTLLRFERDQLVEMQYHAEMWGQC